MHIGLTQFSTGYTIRIDELAREAEDRGFESLFVPEHTHIPTSRRSPWPGGPELPEEYKNTVDPFVGLAYAAASTKKLRIGTAIALLTERDPIVLAKEGSGASLVLVDLNGDGVSRKSVKTLEPTRSHAEITFDGAAALVVVLALGPWPQRGGG